MIIMKLKQRLSVICALILMQFCVFLAGCKNLANDGSHGGESPPLNIVNVGSSNPYEAVDESELIGGPQAAGRVGDTVLSNGIIRVVIQQPGKYPGVGSFGGNIIDADRARIGAGKDQFGTLFPFLNLEWTLNGIGIMAFSEFDVDSFLAGKIHPLTSRAKSDVTPVIVVPQIIDVYEYLDFDFLESAAKALTGQEISFDSRFDDAFTPFQSFDLQNLRIEAFTEYRIPTGARYVEIKTTIFNDGEKPVRIPLGDIVNGSGDLQFLIPGQGFSPTLEKQILNNTPGMIYVGQNAADISYGYFYDPRQFVDAEGNPLDATSVSYSGVTGVLIGETFTKILPLGAKQRANIQTTIPAKSKRTFTRYFIIGDPSAGSILDVALQVLEIPRRAVAGTVIDAGGNPVSDAIVAVRAIDAETGDLSGGTIVTYRTDKQGRFSGYLHDGNSQFAKSFGKGVYKFDVNKTGYHLNGSEVAGTCSPEKLDVRGEGAMQVECVLGTVGVVKILSPLHDAESGEPLPARLTILGKDPSPDRVRPGLFGDPSINERPYGVVGLHYININGGIDVTASRTLSVEPGEYLFVYTHGPEYEMRTDKVYVSSYGITSITPGTLRRVIKTPGFVSADFHIHASASPDSGVSVYHRALAAAAEGLDVLHSSDHDYLFDYAPIVSELENRGWIKQSKMATIVGDEITPNHLGHIHAFPLQADATKANGGALDWSYSPNDRIDPSPDTTMTVQQILDGVRADNPGRELVLQINHVSDSPTSLYNLTGMVTTGVFRESDGVDPLSFFADPMMTRMPFHGPASLPISWEGSPFASADFTAMEVTIGPELNNRNLLETGLPQWFNTLNLGIIVTATANSDSHTDHSPIGLPRNYIMSDIDPADGIGENFTGFDIEAYARAINEHKVVVSAGPFVQITAREKSGGGFAEVGDILRVRDGKAIIRVEVVSPSWAWFDSIELFANTEPTPVDDDGVSIRRGTAEHAHTFYAPYHRPMFVYEPAARYRLRDGTLKDWEEKDGVIKASVELEMEVDSDTWVVALVRGTPKTKGFRPLYPQAVHNYAEEGAQPDITELSMDAFYADPALAVPAWGFTNPIFIDVNGDNNGDGHPFESLYIERGWSPLGNDDR